MVSGELIAAREEVAAALTAAGITSHTWVPERVGVPSALVGPDDPYLQPPQPGTPFRNFIINLQVLLIAGKGTNKAVTEAADTLIEKAHAALVQEWDITGVGAPGQVVLGGQSYLGLAMFIQRSISI